MSRELLLLDANILIDVIVGGVLDKMFTLDYGFAVPDVLFYGELRDQHSDLPASGLNIMKLGEEAIDDTVQLTAKYARAGVSNNDYMVLALARQEGCKLLTGDRALRQVSLAEGVEVRGTIWLMGELYEAGIVSIQEARDAYAAMKKNGSRLPWDEVEDQIGRFEHG